MLFRSGKSRITKAISVFTDAQDMLVDAIEKKRTEIAKHGEKLEKEKAKFEEKLEKMNQTESDHLADLDKASKVLTNVKKILGD